MITTDKTTITADNTMATADATTGGPASGHSRIYSKAGKPVDLPWMIAQERLRNEPGEWSFSPPLPSGWDREKPRYRAKADLSPPARFIDHPGHVKTSPGIWRFAERDISAGEVFETIEWPPMESEPLNETARRIHAHMRTGIRINARPWRDGAMYLPSAFGS